MGFHDLVHGGKAEPGPLPLGGEIGIENMRQGVRRDAHPGIPDFEAQGIGFGMQRQEQLAAVRHGFKPVQAQVQNHLTHPVGIDGHIRQHLGRVKPYGDLVIGGVLPDEPERVSDQTPHPGHARPDVRGARKPYQIADGPIETLHLFDHDLRRLPIRAAFREPPAEIRRIPLDGAERIAQLMGDARGEVAHGGKLFPAADFRLKAADFREVTQEHERTQAAFIPFIDVPAAYRNVLLFLSVPQDDFRIRQHRLLQQLRRQFRQRRREHFRRFPA